MVFFKRKPVTMVPQPKHVAEGEQVFLMQATGEIFTDYEQYLKRFDYLNQKKFVDAINGKSGLTYFAALESEAKSSGKIESVFPEVLRDPILRKVQFSTTSRIDELVSTVYEEFKKDFFPGEDVIIMLDDGENLEGIIREKAKFPMIRGPDGSVQRAAFSRYFVRIDGTLNEEALLDDKHIRRKRNVFTKQNLRSFLKSALQREAWIGAPWLVKEHLAIQYRLPMEIPQHLLKEAHQMQKQILHRQGSKGRAWRPKGMTEEEFARLPPQQQAEMRHLHQQQGLPHHSRGLVPNNGQHVAPNVIPPSIPEPPPIKYPIEDLDLPMRSAEAPNRKRPRLDFLTREQEEYVVGGRHIVLDDIDMPSVGMLLEVWNTLNVYASVYLLDSFTVDDFIDALRHEWPNYDCELIEEIFCAVLKQIVDFDGELQIQVPASVLESDHEESEEQDESAMSTPAPDVPAGRTRSRLSHVDTAADHRRSPTTTTANRAAEMLGDRSWTSRMADRDLEDGGWQVILVGCLSFLSRNPLYKDRAERVLAELAPLDEAPTRETARDRFAYMNINLRIQALELITMLSVSTSAMKEFMEYQSSMQTDIRKKKIEHQRARKDAMEQLAIKDRERKILLPDNMPESPKAESEEPELLNGDIDVEMRDNGTVTSDDPDEDVPSRRSLRGGADRKRKREVEAARVAAEKAKKVAAEKAKPKQSKEFVGLLKDIEALKKKVAYSEQSIDECDDDLREANVQRTKVLGKDRYCNRYYWFERNGQPFDGGDTSSTSHYGYVNGRLWVQGPDDMEIQGFIDRPEVESKDYVTRFGVTVQKRRELEEGETSLKNAFEWGYIDDEKRLHQLIQWLDDKGEREKGLKKELTIWHDKIAEYMTALKDFNDQEAASRAAAEEESASRISTRHKLAEDLAAEKPRCTRWENLTYRREDHHGRPHSKPYKKRTKEKSKASQAAESQTRKGIAVPVNRSGKPVTRQGVTHNHR